MLLAYLFKVSLLLAALTLAYRWLIQYESFTRLNRALLWLNVLAAWSLPLIPLPEWGPVEVQKQFHQSVPEVVQSVPYFSTQIKPQKNSFPETSRAEIHEVWSLMNYLLLIYLLGVVLLASRFLWQLGRLLQKIRHLPSEQLEGDIYLVRDTFTTTPYSFFKWIACNPDQYTSLELSHILVHESEHARQWHSLDLLLAEMQRIALWFNPFSWLHQKLVQSNLEYLADQAVLVGGYNRKLYQVHLLKTVFGDNELPLTNSFAQSILKKRIKMMNQKPSPQWVWGKYAFLLAVLYLSSAFVSPYRRQLIELAPVPLKSVVSAMIEESMHEPEIISDPDLSKLPDPEIILKPFEENLIKAEKDTLKFNNLSKWTLLIEDTLYWAISPLVSLEDIGIIRKDIVAFGGDMKINGLQYDPLNLFLTSISFSIKASGGEGKGSQGAGMYTPTKGYSGYISSNGLGMGKLPPNPLLNAMRKDFEKALEIKQNHLPVYLEDSLSKVLVEKEGGLGTRYFPKESFEGAYAPEIMNKVGIGKSNEGTVLFSEKLKDVEFYLNGRVSRWDEVNSIPFVNLHSISIKSVGEVKKYVLVFTK